MAGTELFQRGAINLHPLALIVGRERPATSGPSCHSKPNQRKSSIMAGTNSIWKRVESKSSFRKIIACRHWPAPLLRQPERARMAEMQVARGRRREPPAIFWKRIHLCQETGKSPCCQSMKPVVSASATGAREQMILVASLTTLILLIQSSPWSDQISNRCSLGWPI